jgi:uncharacterized protein YhaN
MAEIANDVLQKIADRLERIELDLGNVRGRLERIEIDLGNVRAKTDRIDGIEAKVDALSEKVDALSEKTDRLSEKTDRLEADLSAVRVRTDAQPDMRLLFQNVKLILTRFVALERDLVMMRAAMNDYGRDSVTPGEVTAIHEALDTLREADLDQEARLRVLEAHLPITLQRAVVDAAEGVSRSRPPPVRAPCRPELPWPSRSPDRT